MKSSKDSRAISNDLDLLLQDLAKLEEIAANNPFSLFIPHSKQRVSLKSPHKEQWILGGNRSGKTELVIASTAGQLTGQIPARPLAPREGGWRGYICCTTKDKQREVIQEKIDRWLSPRYFKKKPNGERQIYKSKEVWDYIELVDPDLNDPLLLKRPKRNLHGARIYFKSYEEGVMGFESGSIDFCVCDEEPPRQIYEAIDARLLDRRQAGNGYFMCAMTPDPDEGITWTHDEIIEKDGEDPDRLLIVMSTYDNKAHLSEHEIKKLEKKYGAVTSRARIYGIHVSREGMVLDKFRPYEYPEGNIIPPFEPDWRFFTPYECTDWGYKHPWHWGFYAISKDGEYFKYDEIHEEKITVPKMKALVREKRMKYGYEIPCDLPGDPSMARKESTTYSVLDQLAAGIDTEYDGSGRSDFERGKNVWIGTGEPSENRNHPDYIWYPILVKAANNDRDEGWRLLNERLEFEPGEGRPLWFYTKNCIHSIREAKNLQWPKDNEKSRQNKQKEIARKRRDDAPDTDRYASNENFMYREDYNPLEIWFADDEELQRPKDMKRKREMYVLNDDGEYEVA